MNVFFRLGEWCENRRTVKKSELEVYRLTHQAQMSVVESNLSALDLAIKESAKVPTGTANELKAIRIRLDQLELYVGLKREKKAQQVDGAARIS